MKQFLDIVLDDRPTLWRQLSNIVRRVSPEAAAWMEANTPIDANNTRHISLFTAFGWAHSHQGDAFWRNLDHALESKFPEEYPVKVEKE